MRKNKEESRINYDMTDPYAKTGPSMCQEQFKEPYQNQEQ